MEFVVRCPCDRRLPTPETDAAAVAAVIDETGAGSAYLSDISSVHGMIRWVRRRIVLRGLGVGKCLEAGSASVRLAAVRCLL